jgi:2-C-methyl-D-erythritol 4-phosphate cytidylyltransferase
MDKYVLIVAGGKGLRMGGELPKQFLLLAGKPILMHTLEQFYLYDSAIKLVLVLPLDHQTYWKELCEAHQFIVPHQIAPGGETRFHSVRNGLQCVQTKGIVAIHDGVRPFVSQQVITRCFEQASLTGSAIPVLDMVESVRQYEGEGSRSVDRSRYCLVQTPQAFESTILLKSYEQSFSPQFTDDASVVESAGYTVTLVVGNKENCKITTPFDLILGACLLDQLNK